MIKTINNKPRHSLRDVQQHAKELGLIYDGSFEYVLQEAAEASNDYVRAYNIHVAVINKYRAEIGEKMKKCRYIELDGDGYYDALAEIVSDFAWQDYPLEMEELY